MFRLSVAFRVITRSEVQSHVKRSSKRSEEVQDKFGAAVGGDVGRNTMLGEYVNHKELCEFSRGDSIVGRNEYGLFGKAVADYKDSVVAGGSRKFLDEVD